MNDIASTYSPIETDFNQVMERYYPGACVSDETREHLRMIFFAGAACCYSVLVNKPELQETVFEELLSHAEEQERIGA